MNLSYLAFYKKYYVEDHEIIFYRLPNYSRIGTDDVVGINLIGNNTGRHYVLKHGKVNWGKNFVFPIAVKEYIDSLVTADWEDLKARWPGLYEKLPEPLTP